MRFIAAIALLIATTIQNADADGIGINFTGGSAFLQPTDEPGIVAGANWNNFSGDSQTNVALHDSAGLSLPTLLSYTSTRESTGYGTTNTTNSATNQLYRGDITGNNVFGEVTVSLTNIPYAHYDAFVYASQAYTANTLSITDGVTTFYYRGDGQPLDGATSLTRTTSTDSNNPTVGRANYQVFHGLSGSSFSVSTGGSINGIVSNNIFGLQIVPTLYSVPRPTSAPSISVFPPANGTAISTFVFDVLPQHGAAFSPETYAFLTTTANSTGPLIDPLSSKNLKNSVANGLATGFETAALGINVTQNAISLAAGQISADEAVFNLALPYAINKSNMPTFIAASIAKDALEAIPLAQANPPAAAVSFLIGLNATIYGDILAPQLRLFGQDPPDPNFMTVYTPAIEALGLLPTTGNSSLDAALADQTLALHRMSAYLQAVNASFDKYAGAFAAGDNIHATLQMEAVLHFLHLYDDAAQETQAAVDVTQGLLASLGFVSGTYSPLQLAALQSDIAANGLPTDTLNLLNQLGLTTTEQNEVRQQVLDLDPNAFGGTFSDSSSAITGNLFQASSAVPEPNAALLILFGVAGLLSKRRRSQP